MLGVTSIAVAGFSVIVAPLLFLAYALFLAVPNKSAYSVLSCAALVAALTTLQIGHLQHFLGGTPPLLVAAYRVALFIAPLAFYLFGRWAVLPSEPFRPVLLLHLVPTGLLFLTPLDFALPVLFATGVGYAVWLGQMAHALRAQRKHARFEFFYSTVLVSLAVGVLALGFALPFVDDSYFYHFYCTAIGIGFAVVVVALVANPELLPDITEAARVRYGTSTLKGLDVDGLLRRLDAAMTEPSVYRNQELDLATLASQLDVTAHQLSELVNARLGVGFSRYVRERRIEVAKRVLIAEPQASILAISLDTGFKSQSSFYAAFKEITGQSPGSYRKEKLK